MTSSTLFQISEPEFRQALRPQVPSGLALWRLGFRPFYLGAALAAVVLMGLWPAVFMGQLRPANGLAPTWWHAHEMVFGCIVAVVVGFLFTAGKVWTGLPTPRGLALAALASLWAAGRVAGLLAPEPVFFAVDGAFLPVVALVFSRLLVRARNRRNAPVAVVLALLAAANLAFHAAASGRLPFDPMRALQAGLALLVVLESVIGGRVIPGFTRNVTPGRVLREQPEVDRCAHAASAIGLLLWVCRAPGWSAAPVLAIAAAAQAWRLAGWQPWRAKGRPVLWILHVSFAWIPLGLALLALAAMDLVPPSAGVHALAVGATGGLVLGMLTRTARGHTGRSIQVSSLEQFAYAALIVAAVARVVAALIPDLWWALVCVAGTAWIAAFATYLWRFTPWLMSARVDGKDG